MCPCQEDVEEWLLQHYPRNLVNSTSARVKRRRIVDDWQKAEAKESGEWRFKAWYQHSGRKTLAQLSPGLPAAYLTDRNSTVESLDDERLIELWTSTLRGPLSWKAHQTDLVLEHVYESLARLRRIAKLRRMMDERDGVQREGGCRVEIWVYVVCCLYRHISSARVFARTQCRHTALNPVASRSCSAASRSCASASSFLGRFMCCSARPDSRITWKGSTMAPRAQILWGASDCFKFAIIRIHSSDTPLCTRCVARRNEAASTVLSITVDVVPVVPLRQSSCTLVNDHISVTAQYYLHRVERLTL